MIICNIATYPPRLESLLRTLDLLAPQFDRINLVLNEYESIPEGISGYNGVMPIIPVADTKDAGKFLPDVSQASWVFLCDDDLIYPKTYVSDSLREMEALDERNVVGGYHGSVYRRARLKKRSIGAVRHYFRERSCPIGELRDTMRFDRLCTLPVVVDQLGTGVMVLKPELMPPFSYMETAQRFVDVRMARWCFENDILQVFLPHPHDYIGIVDYDETIYRDFTLAHHPHVVAEIAEFALRNGRVGKPANSLRKDSPWSN